MGSIKLRGGSRSGDDSIVDITGIESSQERFSYGIKESSETVSDGGSVLFPIASGHILEIRNSTEMRFSGVVYGGWGNAPPEIRRQEPTERIAYCFRANVLLVDVLRYQFGCSIGIVDRKSAEIAE